MATDLIRPEGEGRQGRIAPPGKISFDEFLAWLDEDSFAEWVDGEVVMMSPAGDVHQDLVRFLTVVLSLFVEKRDLGVVRPPPFLMKLGPGLNAREPDLLFVQTARKSLIKATFLDGPADLVVEVISPESRARDRGEKYYEYEQAGVREYWLIDPQRRMADFYALGQDGIFRIQAADSEGIYRSLAIPGFWLRTEWLFADPLPKLIGVLRELSIV